MKVLQTIQGMNASSGGPSTCTFNLMEALCSQRPGEIELMCFDSQEELLGRTKPWMHLVANDCRTPLALSSNFRKALRREIPDILHCNALWMYSNHYTCKYARKRRIPYVLTPHGMLYGTALAVKPWKKKIMLALWFRKDVMQASCIHATCEKEMENIRAFGYRGPIAIIPNPIAIPDYVPEIKRCNTETNTVGFLGRIHPIKGIEHLVRGLALANNKMAKIKIIGTGEDGYVSKLKQEIAGLCLDNRIEFAGFISGRAKYEALSSLSALFVPSDMENFGMIVPEALLVGTPVMASLGTPWKELNTEGCGWWVDRSPQNIARIIDEATSMSAADRTAMGTRGNELVLRKFTADKIASQMLQLYKWINGETKKPEFVFL